MQTKLTVRISDGVIRKAKLYARRHHISVSKLIEKQLQEVSDETWEPKNANEFSETINELRKGAKAVTSKSLTSSREEYLIKKHVK